MPNRAGVMGRYDRQQMQEKLFRQSDPWKQYPKMRRNMPLRPNVVRRSEHTFLHQNMPQRNIRFRYSYPSMHNQLFCICIHLRRQHHKPMHSQMSHSILRWQYDLLMCAVLSIGCWLLCRFLFTDLCQELSQWSELGQFCGYQAACVCDEVCGG